MESVTADESGKFRFENLLPDEYILEAYQEGFYPLSKKLTIDESIPSLDVLLKPEVTQENNAIQSKDIE